MTYKIPTFGDLSQDLPAVLTHRLQKSGKTERRVTAAILDLRENSLLQRVRRLAPLTEKRRQCRFISVEVISFREVL